MLHRIEAPRTGRATYEVISTDIDFETFNHCPICGKDISPKFIHASFTHTSKDVDIISVVENSIVNALFECPGCHNGILIKYKPSYSLGKNYEDLPVIKNWNTFKIDKIFPHPVAEFPFDEIVAKISPKFKTIYTQTIQAKLEGKNELVGIGYRKSIEFLIKDYLIHKDPDNKPTISSKHLGDCIKEIDNSKIQALAKASTWLGNDETHYVRKHADKDIEDLERFLNSLVGYLSFELTADEAVSFIGK